MSNVSFNDLPKNLQQVLKPYINIAKTVDNAITMAKAYGKWTSENENEYTALNGNKAWGQVMDTYNASKAKQQESKKENGYFTDKNGGFSIAQTAKTVGKGALFILSLPFTFFSSCSEHVVVIPPVDTYDPPIHSPVIPNEDIIVSALFKFAELNAYLEQDSITDKDKQYIEEDSKYLKTSLESALSSFAKDLSSADEFCDKFSGYPDAVQPLTDFIVGEDANLAAIRDNAIAENSEKEDADEAALNVLKAVVQAKYYSEKEE